MTSISRGRNFQVAADGVYETRARGFEVLETPFLNKGSAFTLTERRDLELTGLLPSAVTDIGLQAARSYMQFQHQTDDLAKYIFPRGLQTQSEALYSGFFWTPLGEFPPITYPPTGGGAT